MRVLILLLLPLSLAAQPDALIGEWSMDAESCREARLTYTAAGVHEALMLEEGTWKIKASGRYTRDGSRITVDIGGNRKDELIVVSVDDSTLVMRNADEARMQALGLDSVTLTRCPPR